MSVLDRAHEGDESFALVSSTLTFPLVVLKSDAIRDNRAGFIGCF